MDLISEISSKLGVDKFEKISSHPEFDFDINVTGPSKGFPYRLVFTNGLSSFSQNTSEKYTEFKHVELYFCLPDYMKIEDNMWAVSYLRLIAQLPQKNNTWFGPGDTIPAGNPPTEINEKLKQSYFILSEPMLFKDELTTLHINNLEVRFLAIIPIFKLEFEFKMRNSAKVLIAKLQYKNYTELVDEYRKSVSRKRILGLI
ncbi:MAG: suppressor of fused domain protein [Putridiphycobacter sp.]